MSYALTTAIYAALSGDTTLAGMLAVYEGAPAIITADPVPFDVPRPYVVAAGSVHDEPFGGKVEESTGRDIRRDIRVYDEATGSASLIENICERIRLVLHDKPLVVAGYADNPIARCIAGPIVAPTDPRIQGRLMTFRWVLET